MSEKRVAPAACRHLKLLFLAVIAALALFVPLVSGAVQVPRPTGYVNDLAQVISPSGEARITGVITALKRNSGAEIAVLVVKTTGEEPLFDYAMAVAEAWQPGQRGKDNGVLIVVATEDKRKLQILVGYGLEGILPDGKVGGIEDEHVMPHFEKGDYGGGILEGVVAIATVIDPRNAGTYQAIAEGRISAPSRGYPVRQPRQKGLLDYLVSGLFIVFFIYMAIRHPRLLLLFLIMGGGRRGGGFGGGGFGGGFGGFGGGGFGGGGAGR